MQAIKTLLQTRKHDIMAGSFAVLAMVLLLQLMSRGSAQIAAEAAAAASPASFGTLTETDDTPDKLTRTGATEQRAKAQPLPTNEAEAQPAEEMAQQHTADEVTETADNQQDGPTAELDPTSANDDTAKAAEAAETENAEVVAETIEDEVPQEDKAEQSAQNTDGQVAKADDKPQNDVEAKPKAVEQMTAEEIADAVAAYEQRVRNGEVRLVLEWVLSPEQLNSVVAFYVVGTKNTTIAITPGGLVEYITEAGIPKGKLMGDLPPNRAKWPSVVVSKAGHHLGGNYLAKDASFLLSKPTALQLYRTLASEVGTKTWQPGSVFVLRLFASGGQIQVKFVRPETSHAVAGSGVLQAANRTQARST